MTDTSYSDAVEALTSGLSAKSGDFSGERKVQLARSLLQQSSIRDLDEWSEIELDLSDKASSVLQDYLRELQEAHREEIGKEVHVAIDNAREASELRSRLKSELSKAMDEDQELESIAQKLQDSGLGEIAGREEKEINELGRKLESLDQKGKEVEELEHNLLDVLNGLGIGHGEIQNELEKRANVVGELLRKGSSEASGDPSSDSSDGSTSLSEPWQLVAKDPSKVPDWSKNSADIWKGRWAWVHKSGGRRFNWMVHSGATASQGWKIHVAVDPENEDEVLRVAEAVIPVLNGMDSENKFARNAESLKNKGGETAVKLVTIYPKQDSSPGDTVNQNLQTTEKIVGELVNALEAEGLLSPTKIVKTIGEFNVSKDRNPTRIFIRYDKLGGDEVVDKDGNSFGGRKPGAVPEGFNSRPRKNTSGHDIEVLPGLKQPSFDLYLPDTNYDR